MKAKKSVKKYTYDSGLNESLPNHAHIADIREQLRDALQQLEQSKLSIQLETQKRILAEHQHQQVKEQNLEIRGEMESIKKELGKLSKKYSKFRDSQKQSCDKCKEISTNAEEVQRERQIFLKERSVLKNQIKQLKRNIEALQNKQFSAANPSANNPRLIELVKRDLEDRNRVIDEQKKVIRYLDQKLSCFELEKLQTLNYVESIDQRLQELQMQNTILKGFSPKNEILRYQQAVRERPPSFLDSSPSRRNGSIKNLEKFHKSRVHESPNY